ncbi:hypothetical protein A0H81_04437 [Grifola frondosa]|uniref:Uncharacterized protein n=1 Tax=Grifola frondosa TaxID=5627 RepID=A0A1C7MFM7_GRIFR|nr:hypothetical protein A0H81_04437 [Grifola frondosa]
MDSYVPARPADVYRGPRPPRDIYVAPYYDRREDERYRDVYREREWERRDRAHPEDYRHRARDERAEWSREREVRRWEDHPDSRRGYDRDRREHSPSRNHDWPRTSEDDRRNGRERVRDNEPERKWISRPSKSPPRRMGMFIACDSTSMSLTSAAPASLPHL